MSIGIVFLVVAAFSAMTYVLARRRAIAGVADARAHSLPSYHGGFVALWTGAPALLLLTGLALFGDRLRDGVLQTYAPALALVLALAGGLWAFPKIRPAFRARNGVEGWINVVLIACSGVAVLTTLGIILSLLLESIRFFSAVSPIEFLFGTHWSPQIALRADQTGSSGGFGAVPLFVGTFLIMLIAMAVAAPVGLFSAIYLSEYAGPRTRAWVKPAMEVLAGVPTVVYGFFAALTVGPRLPHRAERLGRPARRRPAGRAGSASHAGPEPDGAGGRIR
jgi:hypothetical protein